jgi:hypothetical protein
MAPAIAPNKITPGSSPISAPASAPRAAPSNAARGRVPCSTNARSRAMVVERPALGQAVDDALRVGVGAEGADDAPPLHRRAWSP